MPPSHFRVTAEHRPLFDEFMRSPVGEHSLELQRLLRRVRGAPVEGKYVLLRDTPFESWTLGQLEGGRGRAVRVHKGCAYTSTEEAERDVFSKRWQQLTGEAVSREGRLPLPDLEDGERVAQCGIIAYANRMSVAPGEEIAVHVHCQGVPTYQAEVLRLVNGDINPAGPGFAAKKVDFGVGGPFEGHIQNTMSGSFMRTRRHPKIDSVHSFTFAAAIWPTLLGKGPQTIVSLWNGETRQGFALFIAADGTLCLEFSAAGQTTKSHSAARVEQRKWSKIGVIYDATSGDVRLIQIQIDGTRAGVLEETVVAGRPLYWTAPSGAILALGARPAAEAGWASDFFNGKIDSPVLLACPVTGPLIADLVDDWKMTAAREAVVAAWDFSDRIRTTAVPDVSGNDLAGSLINLPARSVTGYRWDGTAFRPEDNPRHYSAIHFHDDDLYDANWKPSFSVSVPLHASSGVYCVRLFYGDEEEFVTFCVRPRKGKRSADCVFLLPTATYMAYGNSRKGLGTDNAQCEVAAGRLIELSKRHLLFQTHPEYGASLYDLHNDSSGVCYSSRLRPLVDNRPKSYSWYAGPGSSIWGLAADTHILAWLERSGHSFDVVTDEDLHRDGVELLKGYKTIITGTHPEYFSTRMHDAVTHYLQDGGRIMYLGGNGFYWRIAFHEELEGVIEVRRAENLGSWRAAPGEQHQSFDGAFGGLWRRQGRSPNQLVGVGFTADSTDVASYYRRTPESHDPRAAFIFEGVNDTVLGNFGLIGGGAAGIELDRADKGLGTPDHALIIATSESHTDGYQLCIEDVISTSAGPDLGGVECALVRADMTFFETQSGGAVFSVGSISFAGSLSHDKYENNIARIADNVLRRFLDATAFSVPE